MEIDFTSSAARQYQALFEKKLAEARAKNDGLSLSEAETQQLRGKISLLKELIALPNEKEISDAQSRIEYPEI